MDNYTEMRQKFLIDTDHTGRFIVQSKQTGIKYFVEPVGDCRTNWGDLDPATKKVTGKYGIKYRGSVDIKDSLITEENGFKNITTLQPGISPLLYINKIDEEHMRAREK
jgi:hypothetical protein